MNGRGLEEIEERTGYDTSIADGCYLSRPASFWNGADLRRLWLYGGGLVLFIPMYYYYYI